MSVNEMNLPVVPQSALSGKRLLGILAMIGAPMLFVFIIFGNTSGSPPKTLADRLMCLTGVFYMGFWICGAIGMRKMRATGEGLGAAILFVIQVTLLTFAMMFSVMEVLGYNWSNGGIPFAIFDAGYPLSHLLMNVVGVFVIRAGKWEGAAKYAPFVTGLALPLTFLTGYLFGWQVGGMVFGVMTTTGLGIIGYKVYRQA